MTRNTVRRVRLALGLMVACGIATAADPLVIEFDRYASAPDFQRKDLVPLLRIYASGRSMVHYPEYSQRAGTYELGLSAAFVQALVGEFRASGLAALDLDSLAFAVDQARVAQSELAAIGEVTVTILTVYDGAQTHTLTWSDLQRDALRYPEITTLTRLAEFGQTLSAIADRQDLLPSANDRAVADHH